jgi:hypothetical protein
LGNITPYVGVELKQMETSFVFGEQGIVYYFACLAGYDLSLIEDGNGVSA